MTPLPVNRSGNDLVLNWAGACDPAEDYAVIRGRHRQLRRVQPGAVLDRWVDLGDDHLGRGDRFLLVTPLTGGEEGPYGLLSDDNQLPASGAACAMQIVSVFPASMEHWIF